MTFAKKKFGQNFLKSTSALEKIITASEVASGETVLEIGPGRGALTKKLLETGATIHALEIDPDMIEVLHEKFSEEISSEKLKIISGDIEKMEIQDLVNSDYRVVANIPYYITGLIIRKFLESQYQPKSMTLLVQKEVAERIVDGAEKKVKKTKTQKENILSLSVKIFGDVRYVATVPASAFTPAPKVDSAVIHISNISHSHLEDAGITTQDFFKTVKEGFAQKRKTLRNNLMNAGYEKDAVVKILEGLRVDERVRAEDLTLKQWVKLTQIFAST